MVQLDELRLQLTGTWPAIQDLASGLGLEDMKKNIAEMEAQSAEASFWDDMQNSQKVLQQMQQLKNKVAKYDALVSA